MTERSEKRVRDGLGVVGFGLLGVGLWLLKPAIALIVLGTILLSLAIYGTSRWTEPSDDR